MQEKNAYSIVELWIIAAGPWINTWTVMSDKATAHMFIHSPAHRTKRVNMGDYPQPPQLLL